MEITTLVVLGALVAGSTALGLVYRALNGRIRRASGRDVVRAKEIGVTALGSQATLLQFSTEVCAPCRTTNRVLTVLASEHSESSIEGAVKHVDLDLTKRPDLASRFGVMQTPTTLILDGKGAVRARIGGAPKPEAVRLELKRILEAAA
jgi:thiol-disulfide isomerase/thioredoxin